jgi:SIR2-like domain
MSGLASHAVAQPPTDDHFRMVARQAHNLVVFLGSGANADEHDGPWEVGSGRLPDDRELAAYVAARAGLSDAPLDLSEVAQRARATHGQTAVFEWLVEGLQLRDDATPGEVHELLAGLPGWFREHGLEPRHQLIVTTKYDAALERAFRSANEPFDVAVYTASGTEWPGSFFHVPWDGLPRRIEQPNRYPPTDSPELGFPIVATNARLMRTVIVRISGGVEDEAVGFASDGNYVVTEDDYIDFLSGRPAEEIIPAQLLAKLKKASYLFLGYTMIPWRLRVFLRRIWGGSRLGSQKYWAVEREPVALESELWTEAGVSLYQSSLSDYLHGLYSHIESNADELGP